MTAAPAELQCKYCLMHFRVQSTYVRERLRCSECNRPFFVMNPDAHDAPTKCGIEPRNLPRWGIE